MCTPGVDGPTMCNACAWGGGHLTTSPVARLVHALQYWCQSMSGPVYEWHSSCLYAHSYLVTFSLVLHCFIAYTPYMSQRQSISQSASSSQGAPGGHQVAGGAIKENTSMRKSTAAMTKKAANEIVGRFSDTEKMPCLSWSTPAHSCITGAKLVNVPGSVCSGCYAMTGRYRFSTTQVALTRRLEGYWN